MPILMPSTFCPKEDGDYLLLGQDHGENHQEIARHSKHDADAYDAFNHDVTKVLQAIKPLMDEAPPDFWSDDPEELIRLAAMGSRFRKLDRKVLHDADPAAHRLGGGLPRRLLRVGHPQGLHGLDRDHRHEGRAVLAGLRARAAVPPARRARRRVRGVGVPQAGQRRVHEGPRPRGGVVRRRDQARVAGRPRHHPGRPRDRRRAQRTAASTTRRSSSRRSTRGGPSSSSSTRASCRPTSSRRSGGSASRARPRRSTSRSTAFRATRRSATARTSTAASPTSGRRWSTSSARSTTRSTAGTRSGRTSTARSSRPSIPTWRRPARPSGARFVQYAPYELRESDWDTERERLGDTVQATIESFFPGFGEPGPPARGADAARHRAHGRPVRGQHLRRRVPRAADVVHAARDRLGELPHADRRLLPVRLRHAPGRLRHGRAGQAGGAGGPEGPRAREAEGGNGTRRATAPEREGAAAVAARG